MFKANQSKGVEITVDLKDVKDLITATLNDDEIVELNVGDEYKELINPIIVTENLIDVTKNATIVKVIKDKTGNEVKEIKTDNENTYTITYSIKYKDFADKITQTVKITKKTD